MAAGERTVFLRQAQLTILSHLQGLFQPVGVTAQVAHHLPTGINVETFPTTPLDTVAKPLPRCAYRAHASGRRLG